MTCTAEHPNPWSDEHEDKEMVEDDDGHKAFQCLHCGVVEL